VAACSRDGQFCIVGYTTQPNYDTSIRTVRVPIFQNVTYWRGLEFDLTRAVVREIELKTPFKVVSDGPADTELLGKILGYTKGILNYNQNGEVRDVETTLGVELVWRDLRPGHFGEILSQPKPGKPGQPPPPPPPPGAKPPVVLVQSIGGFIPEIGQSLTTAQKQNVDRLAVQIVSMMEKPW